MKPETEVLYVHFIQQVELCIAKLSCIQDRNVSGCGMYVMTQGSPARTAVHLDYGLQRACAPLQPEKPVWMPGSLDGEAWGV